MSSTVTIEFERMPEVPHPVRISFWRGKINPNIIIPHRNGEFIFNAIATCHPSDTFSWEVGMRLCVKRIGNSALYRAFRRWMWLAKAAHECRYYTGCAYDCKFGDSCKNISGLPATCIAREFGRVTVRVT